MHLNIQLAYCTVTNRPLLSNDTTNFGIIIKKSGTPYYISLQGDSHFLENYRSTSLLSKKERKENILKYGTRQILHESDAVEP